MPTEDTENSSTEEKTEENISQETTTEETVNYAELLEGANAKIATLETALEAKEAENIALKAANYDLLMQVGIESSEENSLDEEVQLTIDDLF
jgi:hypothetical protein